MNATSRERPDAPDRRTRLVRVWLVAAVVIVAIVVPGYFGARASFFGHVPAVSDEYEAWASSTHLEAECRSCHVPPGALSQVTYRVRTVGEFYLSLIMRSRVPQVFETPTNEACLACHSDLRTVSPEGDLQIPHRAHVTILEMECVECHGYLVHELSPEGKHTPPMIECLTCHDGDTAQDACSACHTEKAAPESHSGGEWLIAHAAFGADDPECIECHKWAENWCVDCHSQRPQSHGEDWRAVHGERVAEHRSCEACHDDALCVRCHGEVPQLNYDPTLELVE